MQDDKRLAISDKQKDLAYFYPTSVLVTAPEIIFFWVARMIMAGLEFMKEIPFKDVYIHGTVRDIEGKKMSKSLGNIIDPLDIINEYGADALRFSLIAITAQGQDVHLSKERFEQGRNFANKIWNASRFILMNLGITEAPKPAPDAKGCVGVPPLREWFGAPPSAGTAPYKGFGLVNRWILSRFYSTLKQVNNNLAAYRFNEAANLLYGFFWHEFCDWYLEMIKSDIKNPQIQVVMYKVLEKFLRAIHPFMPFISEEVWQALPHQGKSISIQPSPHIQEQIIDKKLEERMSLILETITTIRNMRQELDIPQDEEINAIISSAAKETRELVSGLSAQIKKLAKLSRLDIEQKYTHIKSSISAIVKDMHITLPLEGVIDIEKEKAKLEDRIAKVEAEIKAKEKTLANKEFVKKAPEEIVAKESSKLEELKEALKKVKAARDGFR